MSQGLAVCIALYWECESHYVDFTDKQRKIKVREVKEGEEVERESGVELQRLVERYRPGVSYGELSYNL